MSNVPQIEPRSTYHLNRILRSLDELLLEEHEDTFIYHVLKEALETIELARRGSGFIGEELRLKEIIKPRCRCANDCKGMVFDEEVTENNVFLGKKNLGDITGIIGVCDACGQKHLDNRWDDAVQLKLKSFRDCVA